MSAEQVLRDWLLADPAIAAEIDTRVYFGALPSPDDTPALLIDLVDTTTWDAIDGSPIELQVRRYAITAVAVRRSDVERIASLVQRRLHEGGTGITGSTDSVEAIEPQDVADLDDVLMHHRDGVSVIKRREVEVLVTYRQQLA